MKNPWQELPNRAPYVLPEDRPHVEAFNAAVSDAFRLDLSLLPHPFLGPRDAPLVVLGLNPGISERSASDHAGELGDQPLRGNLGPNADSHLHLGFLPDYAETGLGRWWQKCFRSMREDGVEPEQLSRSVLAVEFHGYHSKRWRPIPITLPSQAYGFWLVEQAIDRGGTIAVMRGVRPWEVAVPCLRGYSGRVPIANARTSSLSVGNCGQDGYDRVLAAVR